MLQCFPQCNVLRGPVSRELCADDRVLTEMTLVNSSGAAPADSFGMIGGRNTFHKVYRVQLDK
jgi:hypothetical protein